jgi:hypothetical protein
MFMPIVKIVKNFIKKLETEKRVGKWKGTRRSSQNLYQIENGPILYVKESSFPVGSGFWGITRNRIDELNSSGKSWKLVLLITDEQHGYVFPSKTVNEMIKSGKLKLAQDGDYKINERSHLKKSDLLESYSEIVNEIMN